jgi:hypothetical protein
VLDKHKLIGQRDSGVILRSQRIDLPVRSGNRRDDLDRSSRPSEALTRECGVPDIEKAQAPPRRGACIERTSDGPGQLAEERPVLWKNRVDDGLETRQRWSSVGD